MITHTIESYWIPTPKSKEDKVKVTNLKNLPKFRIFEYWNRYYTRHTFWSCLIRCANMKWIRWVLLKIQSGHDSVHRRTDGQGDTSIPPFQLRWSGGYNQFQRWSGYINNTQGSKLRGAEGQNAPKLSPNAPRLLNLGAKFCYPIQPDICFEV